MRVIFSSLLFAILMVGSPMAATHAIIIGIDNYVRHPKLLGAVNDARHLEETLQPKVDGVFEVLVDEDATRAGFDKAWKQVMSSAIAEDLLILSFSGHGVTRTDDDVFRDESDGLDELLLFQPFDERPGSGFTEEYLLDDELFVLFKQAEKKKIKILFIADACHAGGLSRMAGDLDISKAALPFRFTQLGGELASPAENFKTAEKKPEIPDNVAFLSATNERMRLREIMIDKKPRGALSYFVARAFEGKADSNKDDIITDDELKKYVIAGVRTKAYQHQTPEMITSRVSQRLIRVEKNPDAKKTEPADVRLFVKNFEGVRTVIKGATYVDSISTAEVVFDGKNQKLFNSHGDMLVEDMDFSMLSSAISAIRVRNSLVAKMEEGRSLEVTLNPDDRLYTAPCEVQFKVEKFDYRHFTVVNLAASGRMQFLFPITAPGSGFKDPLSWDSEEAWQIKNRVSEPFGADFLIFIASERPLVNLHNQLWFLEGTMEPEMFLKLFSEEIRNQNYQIGLRGAYTSRKGNPCQR